MSHENVKLWFAKDVNGSIVTINDVNESNKNNSYHCPVCGSTLKAKATNSKSVSPHFAHIDASKCNSESQMHFWFKHRFIEKGDSFTITSDEERVYICKEVLVEKEYKAASKNYRPDVTILTECGSTIYFEMAFSNTKKVKDYIDIWLELKNIVVEVDIKSLVDKDNTPKFKALFYDGKCFNTKRNDTYYNTIGKYKEEKLKGKFNESLNKRIRKLDWLWDDVLRYNNGKISIKEMALSIDNIDKEDRFIVDEILHKQSCISILQDYKNYIKEKTIKKRDSIIEESRKEISRLYGEGNSDLIYISEISINEIFIEIVNGEKIGVLKLDTKKEESAQLIQKIVTLIGETVDFYRKECICDDYNEIANNITDRMTSDYRIKKFIKKLRKAYFDLKIHTNNIKPTRKYLNVDVFDKGFKTSFKLLDENGLTLKKINFIVHEYESFDSIIDNVINSLLFFINDMNYLQNEEDIYKLIFDLRSEYNNYEINVRYNFFWVENEEVCEILINNIITCYVGNNGIYEDEKLINKIEDNKLEFLNNYLIDKIENMNKIRNCTDCSRSFTLNMSEIKFYKDKGFYLPKRCKSCRNKRKKNK